MKNRRQKNDKGKLCLHPNIGVVKAGGGFGGSFYGSFGEDKEHKYEANKHIKYMQIG